VSLSRNFFTSLAAVVLGNCIYFLIMPHLPTPAQHQWKRIDLGLVVDFWICLALYGVLSFFFRSHAAHPTSEQRR
jgi:hypothetical protein